MLAIPMWLLFEVGVFFGRHINRIAVPEDELDTHHQPPMSR
jgi:Sec-independent protein secretion pathway component TatC